MLGPNYQQHYSDALNKLAQSMRRSEMSRAEVIRQRKKNDLARIGDVSFETIENDNLGQMCSKSVAPPNILNNSFTPPPEATPVVTQPTCEGSNSCSGFLGSSGSINFDLEQSKMIINDSLGQVCPNSVVPLNNVNSSAESKHQAVAMTRPEFGKSNGFSGLLRDRGCLAMSLDQSRNHLKDYMSLMNSNHF